VLNLRRMLSRALITGVNGFLGRHIAQAVAGRGLGMVGVDLTPTADPRLPPLLSYRALRLPDAGLSELVRATRPDVCIHCAGGASVEASLADPASDFTSAVAATASLLEALRRDAPSCRVVFLSSAAVYGDPERLPVTETASIQPLSPYGYHKRLAELLLREYVDCYRLPCLSLRIFSAYGAGLERQVVWDLAQRAQREGVLRVRGTGSESRDFIHAGDIARAVVLVMEHGAFDGGIYNLASGVETPIDVLAQRIVALSGRALPVSFDGVAPAGTPRRWRADITRIAALGFAPATALDVGLAEVVAAAAASIPATVAR
jgi:UDP-glucose 4-epimerase